MANTLKVNSIRYPNLDKLRGFAALSVLIFYVIAHTHWNSFPVTWPLVWFRFGWMGVDLFFVISGVVIYNSAYSLRGKFGPTWGREYWKRRLCRIVPLYYFTALCFIIFVVPNFALLPIRTLLWHVGVHLAFIYNWFPATWGSIDGVNWSIGVEMQFYALVFLLLPWLSGRPKWLSFLPLLLVAWAWRAITLRLIHPGPYPLFIYSAQLPGTIDEFAIGMLFARMNIENPDLLKSPSLKKFYPLVFVGVASLIGLMLHILISTPHFWHRYTMVVLFRTYIGLSMFGVVFLAVSFPYRLPRFISWPFDYLGEISYGIYLWQLLVILSLKRVTWLTNHVEFLKYSLILTVILASGSYFLFEKLWMDRSKDNTRGGLEPPASMIKHRPQVLRLPLGHLRDDFGFLI